MGKIQYPRPLKKGDTVGVTAPSSGISETSHFARFDLLRTQYERAGYFVKEGHCLRSDVKHVSGTSVERARDLHNMLRDPTVRLIIPPWGGELLIDMLPRFDFELFQKNPKWILGYSDLSTLLFPLTLKTSIATAHGSNFMDLIENQVYGVHKTYFSALGAETGYDFTQESFPQYQQTWVKFEDKLDGIFNVSEPVRWKSLGENETEKFSGRLIGGCLDTLVHLVGTPYGDLPRFVQEHREEGVVLYLENCDFPPTDVARALWQMRFADWFRDLKGIVFGRSSGRDAKDAADLSYLEALRAVLLELHIPVIYDADIGHKPPQMILINGALSTWELEGDRGRLHQKFC